MDNAALQALIDELDELSTWLWMGGKRKKDIATKKKDIATKIDIIINRHRPRDFIGD